MKIKDYLTIKNTSYIFFIILFTIICLELFGRIYLTYILRKSTKQKFRFNSYRIYEHVPGFKEGDGKRDWIIINQQGFRRTENTIKEKPSNTVRIFLMGGSAAHGISTAEPYPPLHIYPNETIDAYLENSLKKRFPKKNIEVINAAVTGYQVFQHTSYILSELLDYQPDLFIFFDGANDHYSNNPNYDYYLNNRYQYWAKRLQNPSIESIIKHFILWTTKFSAFSKAYLSWDYNKDAFESDEIYPSTMKCNSKEEMIKNHKVIAQKSFLRSIETNIQILKHSGIEAIICLQPELSLRDTLLMSDTEKKFLNINPQAIVKNENIIELHPTVHEEVKELSQKYSIKFIDVNEAFNNEALKKKQLFSDYCHLTPEGGKVSAEYIEIIADSVFTKIMNK